MRTQEDVSRSDRTNGDRSLRGGKPLTTLPTRSRASVARHVVVLLLLALAPLFVDSYTVDTLARICIFALFAISLDLLVGLGGLPSLGHAAYFATGAYTAGYVALNLTSNGLVQLGLAAVVTLVLGIATGWIAVRSQGIYFLMLTLAIGEIVFKVAESWEQVTGGANGMYGIPATSLPVADIALQGTTPVYLYVLTVTVLGYAAVRLVSRAPLGFVLRGLRDSGRRMETLGYSTFRYKYLAFCIAAAIAGVAGALLSAHQRLVSPADAGFGMSAMVLLAVVIGGSGSIWGPVLGAALVVLVRDYFGTALGGHAPLLLGAIFIVVVYAMPRGIAGLQGRFRRSS